VKMSELLNEDTGKKSSRSWDQFRFDSNDSVCFHPDSINYRENLNNSSVVLKLFMPSSIILLVMLKL